MLGLILISLILAVSLWFYLRPKRTSWDLQGVKSPSDISFLGQALILFFKKDRWLEIEKYYNRYKQDGMFVMYEMTGPNLYICSPNLIRDVMVKDFDHFVDRRSADWGDNRINETLENLKGDSWKSVRAFQTSSFSSGKIKSLFGIIKQKANNLNTRMSEDMDEKGYVNIRKILDFYTMDVVVYSGFGLETDYLRKKDNFLELIEHGKTIMHSSFKSVSHFFLLLTMPFIGKIIKRLEKPMDYLDKLVYEMIRQRKESGKERGDYLDLLVQMKDGCGKIQHDVTGSTVVAQAELYITAGYHTTANVLSHAVYYLAQYPKKQAVLRRELEEKLSADEDFTYEKVLSCDYLNAVFSEALRLQGSDALFERVCSKDYIFKEKGIYVKKGTIITIPGYNIHHDPQYWKNPYDFVPERFLPENRGTIVPFTYMPFGHGPRGCIAKRFGQLIAKVCLAKMFLQYEVEINPGYEKVKFLRHPVMLKPDPTQMKIRVKKVGEKLVGKERKENVSSAKASTKEEPSLNGIKPSPEVHRGISEEKSESHAEIRKKVEEMLSHDRLQTQKEE